MNDSPLSGTLIERLSDRNWVAAASVGKVARVSAHWLTAAELPGHKPKSKRSEG